MPPSTPPRIVPIAFIVALHALGTTTACESGPPLSVDEPGVVGDAIAGRAAFAEDCASCHASGDGFDLAFFGMPDTAVVRRALPHVDADRAADIAAHVASLDVVGVSRDTRPFQPGNRVLASDVGFAFTIFGEDAWPEAWTTADLRAVDLRELPLAVPLPLWSDEETNLDWMPDAPLPGSVLEARGGAPRALLDAYYATRSPALLGEALFALRSAARGPEVPGPCFREAPGAPLTDVGTCFDVDRWISTLLAQHVLRGLDPSTLPPPTFDPWWDVGNDARLSFQHGGDVDREIENWASWMILSWVFAPERHASVYLGSALLRLGLPRHATVTALRTAVERPPGSLAPYLDVRNAAGFAPNGWVRDAIRFGYRHLLDRLDAGESPAGPGARSEAAEAVEQAYARAAPKTDAAGRDELSGLRDRILEDLAP